MKRSATVLWFFAVLSLVSLMGARILIGEWLNYFWLPFCFFFLFSVLAVAMDFAYLKKSLSSYRSKLVFRIFARSSILLFILLGLASLVFEADIRVDLSRAGMNQLDPASVSALASVSKKTKLYAFFKPKASDGVLENFRRFAELVEKESDKIEIKILSSEDNPDLVQKYQIKKLPSFVVATDDRNFVLENFSEDQMINGFLRANKEKDSLVCFLDGLDGIPFQDSSNYRLKLFKEQLAGLGYHATAKDVVSYLQKGQDCDSLVLAGIKQNPPPALYPAMDRFLDSGKSILVLQDPGKAYGLSAFYKKYGIEYFNDYIIDTDAQAAGFHAATPLVSEWSKESSLSKNMNKQVAVFPVASRLGETDVKKENFKLTKIAMSSAVSFTKPELKSQISFNPGVDASGPFPVAILSENKKSKLLVVGDADFVTDEYLPFKGNRSFANNIISYLISSEGEISVAPKSFYRELFIFTPNQAKYFLMLGILPIPFLMLAFSIWMWVKRARFL